LRLRENGIRIALGSASKNAQLILQKLDIAKLFDAIIDGNSVSKAKPDPEVFLKGAKAINVAPANCVVFEDALSGIQAAKAGGMRVIALGTPDILPGADKYVRSFVGMFA
jgi:beta-phosphoglucomutase